MIVGVGIDLIEIERIRSALDNARTGQRFRERVFTPAEIAYCERRRNAAESFAARFAAKEALVKALGEFVPWGDVEVVRGDARPELRLSGRAAAVCARLGVVRLHLSITHSQVTAGATVVAEGGDVT